MKDAKTILSLCIPVVFLFIVQWNLVLAQNTKEPSYDHLMEKISDYIGFNEDFDREKATEIAERYISKYKNELQKNDVIKIYNLLATLWTSGAPPRFPMKPEKERLYGMVTGQKSVAYLERKHPCQWQ